MYTVQGYKIKKSCCVYAPFLSLAVLCVDMYPNNSIHYTCQC